MVDVSRRSKVSLSGNNYPGKLQNLYIEEGAVYLHLKQLFTMSLKVGNLEKDEIVRIAFLKEYEPNKSFILVSNGKFVAWVSLDQIIKN
jgi:hypothetical protein